MKIEKKIAKLLSEHPLFPVIEQLIKQTSLPTVMLQISNHLCNKASLKDKATTKIWLKRAKAVHQIMEEINLEQEQLAKNSINC